MRLLGRLLLGALALAVTGSAPEARAGPDATIDQLAHGLDDPDRGVRYACVIALGKGGAPAFTLGRALRDSAWCVRREAAWWLRRSGTAALPVLEAALQSEDDAVRATAAWSLSGFDAGALPLLRRALQDPVEAVRIEALMAARRMGTRRGRPHLEALEPALRARFTRGSAEERYEAALALVWATPEAGGDVCDLLAARLVKEGARSRHRDEIARALLHAGKAGAETIAAFTGPKWRRFQWSLESAGRAVESARRVRKPVAPAPHIDDEPPTAPNRQAPDPASIAPLLRARADPDVRQRIATWLDLGERHADAAVFTPAHQSTERDERIAVATALGTATGDAASVLAPLLTDANWRVRCAAVRSWGRRGEDSAQMAPLLSSSCLPLARAAYEALRTARPAPAEAVAAALASGHYGALHFARLLFDAFGAGGAPATRRLTALLSHVDVNVRETAARCLAAIGPPAAAAVPALIRALADDRLCVVAHASLALGHIGDEERVRATLQDKRARVRAYGAFALGWMLGARRGVDQVPYEPRLPVLDVGRRADTPASLDAAALDDPPGPEETALLRRALWSSDPQVSIPAAARLDYDALDAEESERAMELLLPEGQRRGGPADFGRLRSIIGSSELPACIGYVARATRTTPSRSSIFGNFHRIARADHLPWLCHLERVEELEAIEGNGEIWMPANYTARFMRERLALGSIGDPGPRPDDPARALIRDWLRDPQETFGKPQAWRVNAMRPTADDVALLLRLARRARERPAQEEPFALWAALRALGRVDDPISAAFLEQLAAEGSVAGNTAAAALARRGRRLAGALLAERGRTDETALLLLADASPRHGARAIAQTLAAASSPEAIYALFRTWEENEHPIGARLHPDVLIGLEPSVLAEDPDATTLARCALTVPGCATKRVAALLFDDMENDAARPYLADEDEASATWWLSALPEIVAFLHAADPERTKALLSYWVTREDDDTAWREVALDCLLLLGDTRHVGRMLARFEATGDFDLYTIDRIDGPALRAWLAARSKDPKLGSADRRHALAALAHLQGWPNRGFDLGDFPDAERDQVADWVRQARIDLVRAAHPTPGALSNEEQETSAVWARLGRRALAGDPQARAAFWSALRAGRYRWIHYNVDARMHSLGRDGSTYPHWIADLDSNCCRVSDGLGNDLFEEALGLEDLYGTERTGFGRPLSERVGEWFDLKGGALTWSPILDRWIPEPE